MRCGGGKRLVSVVLVLMLLAGLCPALAEEPGLEEPELVAEAAILIDYDTGLTIYEKDADTMRVPASMTKVMTAYIIFEELEAGNLTLDTQITITAEDSDRSRDSHYPARVYLKEGSTVSVDMLLKLILIPSASASCIVAANYISGSEEAFVERMNATAVRLGMTANYENSHGAFPHELTARSQAKLVQAFIRRFPQVLEYTSMTEVEFDGKVYPNTNKLLTDYAYEGCDGFKTGTITESGYCLAATAERDGRRLIAVVMKSSDDVQRHTDAAALLDYGFAWLEEHSPVFDDIGDHWARDEIEALADTGAALHVLGGDYRPDDPITRGEFAAMLFTALEPAGLLDDRQPGAVEFLDLAGTWAEGEIRRAAAYGLISGAGDGLFAPEQTLTREQAMVMLGNAWELPQVEVPAYRDSGELSDWARDAAGRCVAAGLFRGDGGMLYPQASITRAEAAAVVMRLLELAA